MTLDGINVRQGERRKDQPFRVGVALPEPNGPVWTNDQVFARAAFLAVVKARGWRGKGA